VVSFTAKPNPGKVATDGSGQKIIFSFENSGLKDGEKSYCKIYFDNSTRSHYNIFDCSRTGTFEHTYKYAGQYKPSFSIDCKKDFASSQTFLTDDNDMILNIKNADGTTSNNTVD